MLMALHFCYSDEFIAEKDVFRFYFPPAELACYDTVFDIPPNPGDFS